MHHPLMARVDILTQYTKEKNFVVYQSSNTQPIPEAEWMEGQDHRGVVVEQFGRSMEFTIKALKDTDITIELKGPWILDGKGGLVQKWVRFTSFEINSQPIISHNVKVWNALPYSYVLHAQKDKSYQIKLKWRKK